MKIHAIETGRVQVTQRWMAGHGTGLRRLLNAVFDKNRSDWLPIYAWVIEHPEGMIVVDTGIPFDANKPRYFPPYMPFIQRAARFEIFPEQEIGHQMRALGLNPEKVRWVVLTHLHQDHDGGLHHFPNSDFVVSKDEWEFASGLRGRLNGYLNQRWPRDFVPNCVNFNDGKLGPFTSHATLTRAGDIRLVPTPGHAPGHMSVLLHEGDKTIMFAGDTSYSQENLIAMIADGVGTDIDAERETHLKIITYAAEHPTVYLPSHDPDAAYRLNNRITLNSAAPKD